MHFLHFQESLLAASGTQIRLSPTDQAATQGDAVIFATIES